MNADNTSAQTEEISRLSRCLQDVAALTALPVVWIDCDGRKAVDSLVDMLADLLDLDFICISITRHSTRLSTRPSDKTSINSARVKGRQRDDGQGEAIEKAYQAALNAAADHAFTSFPDPWDFENTNVAVLRVPAHDCDGILIAGKREAAFPRKTDVLLLQTGVNQAAVFLNGIHAEFTNAWNVRDASEAEARDKFLVRLDSALRPLTDPSEMTLAAATLLGRHLDVDRCAYADIEDDQDTMNLFGNYLRSPEIRSIVGQLRFMDFGAEVLRLMREDKPFVVNDIDTHQPAVDNKHAYRATQIQAVICVPLHKNGRFVAAMAVHQCKPRQWTSKEVELVQHVASRCWESIERSRIERDLSKKYAALFTQAPIAICVMEGPQHIFRLANPSFLSLVSAEDRDLIDRPLSEAMPEVRGQGFEELLDQVYSSGIPYIGKEATVLLKRESGLTKLFLDFIYQPRFNSQGLVDGVIVVATDVSEKVAARLDLEAAIRELRATTAENKRLLEEMRQYAKALKDNDRRKDEFLATLAHELRNPLAPIKNALEILRLAHDREKVDKLRNLMEAQLTHLIRLVDDLMDMSRINEGKIELRKERLAIQSAIQTAIDASKWQLDAQQQELVVDISPQPLWVMADPTRLIQVINNLLNNAGKYTPAGGKIELSAYSDGLMGIVEIADNGIGIPPEMVDTIFEPFTQLQWSRQYAQGGLGIGLSLVKRLMQMHEGFVRVDSAGTNKGSTFTVGFPVADEQAAAVLKPVLRAANSGHAQPLKVLVVDDNVDSAQTIGWMLESEGHLPLLAYNGNEALALALDQHPDVILLDLGLPDISGYEVCRTLRKTPAFEHTLIVAQTGWGQKRDRDMSHAAGFDRHLVKPIHLADLAQLLSTHSAQENRK